MLFFLCKCISSWDYFSSKKESFHNFPASSFILHFVFVWFYNGFLEKCPGSWKYLFEFTKSSKKNSIHFRVISLEYCSKYCFWLILYYFKVLIFNKIEFLTSWNCQKYINGQFCMFEFHQKWNVGSSNFAKMSNYCPKIQNSYDPMSNFWTLIKFK